MLALLALAELLGMSLWFSGSAVGPQLQARGVQDEVAQRPGIGSLHAGAACRIAAAGPTA